MANIRHRSAVDGRFIAAKQAKQAPRESIREVVRNPTQTQNGSKR